MRIHYYLLALFIFITAACNGELQAGRSTDGKTIEILPVPPVSVEGGIEGPSSVYEGDIAIFSISGYNLDHASILWSVDPPEAGVLGTPTFSKVGFHPADMRGESDLEAVIKVEISTDGADKITRSRTIEIVNLEEQGSWKLQWVAGGWEDESDLCIDAIGNIYVTGETIGKGDLDPGSGECIPDTVDDGDMPGNDAYVTRLNPDGEHMWSRWWGGTETGLTSDIGLGVDTDSKGNVYVIGTFKGECDFDPGPGVEMHESMIDNDRPDYSNFLSSFDGDGNFRWVRILHGRGFEAALSVVVDKNDEIICSGEFSRTALEGYKPGGRPLREDRADAFLAKFNTAGDVIWYLAPYETEGRPAFRMVSKAAVDNSRNIYITGYFSGEKDLDPGEGKDVHGKAEGTGTAVYIASFSPDGAYRWGKAWLNASDSGSGARGFSICMDRDSNVYVTGYYSGTLVPEDGDWKLESITTDEGRGILEGFALSVTSKGKYRWVTSWGDYEHNVPRDICVSPSGMIYATGEFYGVDSASQSDSDKELRKPSGYLIRLTNDGRIDWVGGYDKRTWIDGSAVATNNGGDIFAMGLSPYDHKMCLMKFSPDEYWPD